MIFVFWPLFVLIIRLVARYNPSSSGKNQSKILQIPFASKFCELLNFGFFAQSYDRIYGIILEFLPMGEIWAKNAVWRKIIAVRV